MKCYQPEVNFASRIEDKNKEEFVEVITIRLTRSAAFPVKLQVSNVTPLLMQALQEAVYLLVTSASVNTLCPIGIAQCPFKLGGHSCEFVFIVSHTLARPIILGLDFMHKHEIRLSWLDTRKGFLSLEDKVLVVTVDICETGPQLMTYSSLRLPARKLAVINIHADLKENSTEHTYEVKPNSLLMHQYPNMAIIPLIYIIPILTDTIFPFIVINLSTESIFLS